MPTLTLTFILPEEQNEAELSQKAGAMRSILTELDAELRSAEKYDLFLSSPVNAKEAKVLARLREWLCNAYIAYKIPE